MVQLSKVKMFYTLAPGEPAPDVLHYFRQVPGRHRRVHGQKACEHALFLVSLDQAFKWKRVINAQVRAKRSRILDNGSTEQLTSCNDILVVNFATFRHGKTVSSLLVPPADSQWSFEGNVTAQRLLTADLLPNSLLPS